MPFDLVLRHGRVVDPSQELDRVTDVAFADGKVAAVGDGLDGAESQDVTGRIVTPGLIDLHTHVYWGGTSLGIDAALVAGLSSWPKALAAGARLRTHARVLKVEQGLGARHRARCSWTATPARTAGGC